MLKTSVFCTPEILDFSKEVMKAVGMLVYNNNCQCTQLEVTEGMGLNVHVKINLQ